MAHGGRRASGRIGGTAAAVTAVLAAAVTATLLLSGCAGTSTAPIGLATPTRAATVAAPTAAPSATTTSPSTTTTPSAVGAAVPGNPAPNTTPQALTPLGNPVGTINGMTPQTPVDSGPSTMAHGTVGVNAEGVPETYTVASGDDYSFVANRLGLDEAYLYTLNSVRRTDFTLYVGDVLNLDPEHIATLGSENGVVSQLPLPDGAPVQS